MWEMKRWLCGSSPSTSPPSQRPPSASPRRLANRSPTEFGRASPSKKRSPPKPGVRPYRPAPVQVKDSHREPFPFESKFPMWMQRELLKRENDERQGLVPPGAGFSPQALQPWHTVQSPPSQPARSSARPLSAGHSQSPGRLSLALTSPPMSPQPARTLKFTAQPLVPAGWYHPTGRARSQGYQWVSHLHSQRATHAAIHVAQQHWRWADQINRLACAERLKCPPPVACNL